ncbi:MAG: S8 family peptidase [Gaiellaceae bacterium]
MHHRTLLPVFPARTPSHFPMTRVLALVLLAAGVLTLGGVEPRTAAVSTGDRAQVVVTLASPALGLAPGGASRIAREQRAFRRALASDVPGARVRWRYRLVANGFAVDVPRSQMPRLRGIPGVRDVFASTRYGPQLDRSPGQIGAPGLWGSGLGTAGQGVKIGIIDTGVDASHPFLAPAGYTMPPGFPRGQTRFTSAKVIVARAFAPPGATSRFARDAFDPEESSHGTHVAGIAAGNNGTDAPGDRTVSGVAPRAYIGNYKALVRTDVGLSPNGNSPELVAAIEAAVRDGMDIINLSLGEPEIEPTRDLVARALDAAAAAGVVPVVAAGNDFGSVGPGSVSSPGSSARAITVAAAEIGGPPSTAVLADFSSVGPTAISLRMKPDVSAPGVDIFSSVPSGWTASSGTSMASPHVAGAAALLVQRHPGWTVAQVKSALVQTGTALSDERGRALGPQFQGGGLVSLARADRPLLFAEPSSLSFGLLTRATSTRGSIELADAGDGAGTWHVTDARASSSTGRATLTLPSSVDAPGTLAWEIVVPAAAREGVVGGTIELRRGTEVRRVPYWGRVTAPMLGRHRVIPLSRTGVHTGTTRGRPSLVRGYRYPENPRGVGVTTALNGPETVYRVRLTRRVANFGVVILRRANGSFVEPRIVAGLDENRIAGYAGLPFASNPYLAGPFGFQSRSAVVAALSPAPGDYAVVFDSATRAGAGGFMFRYWVNDVTPPNARLLDRTVVRGEGVRIRVTDSGSGVDPGSLVASWDGLPATTRYRNGVVSVATAGEGLASGKHRLRLTLHDYQETKNTENVARILPNARVFTATVTVRGR